MRILSVLFLFCAVLFPAPAAFGEFVCRQELWYSWLPDSQTQTAPVKSGASDARGASGAGGAAAPANGAASDAPLRVYWLAIDAAAADEAAAKERLAEARSREGVRALDVCRNEHENLTSCVTKKFAASAGVMGSLSFTARRAMETAVTLDCGAQQGKCQDLVAGEPQCIEKGKKEEPADDAGKKDDKKGKGKEKPKK